MGIYPPVHTLLEDSSDRDPSAVALVHGDERLSYGELESRANRLANLLRTRGIERGDRVALLAENGSDYVVAYFGILKAGACCVALNDRNNAHTNAKLLADAGAVGLVARPVQFADQMPGLMAESSALRFLHLMGDDAAGNLPERIVLSTGADAADVSDERPDIAVTADDLCTILYTSGSTGMPRGVTLSHGNLAANTQQILAYLELTAEDSVMVVLPFHYSFGKSLLLNHIAVGGKLVVDNRFAYPHTVLQTMAAEKVTGFSGVPSTYAILSAKTDFLARDWSHLRYLTQAGGAMTPTLTRKIRAALPENTRLFIMYGQTEASARLAYVPPERLLDKLGAIGIGIPGVDLGVRRPDGSECDVGEVGEVVARGDNIMQGYWNDPEETALVLRERTLYTGDLARRDEDGFIFIVDRIKNMIKSGANRVSGKEVEDVIAEVEGVVEVAVVGVPDDLLGEAIEAFVVTGAGDGKSDHTSDRSDAQAIDAQVVDAQTILAHCRRQLALYKLPRSIRFLDTLPKNAAGKIVKRELVKLVGAD